MNLTVAEEPDRRSLLGKFQYAVLFQALLTLVVAIVAFVPTLRALSQRAETRRREASREVIESGVNSMARFVAMELGRDFLPDLWAAADRASSEHATEERDSWLALVDRQTELISQRVAEKMSYNSVLVDLAVVVPHDNPRSGKPGAIVLPRGHAELPTVSVGEAIELANLKQLTPLDADQHRLRQTSLGRYMLMRTEGRPYKAYLMPIRREGFPYGIAGLVINTELITEQFENQWRVFWRGLEDSLIMLAALSTAALAGGAVFVLVLAARLVRPLEAMRSAIEGLRGNGRHMIDPADLREAGDRLTAIEADPADEVGELRHAFLEMSENLADTLTQKADALRRLKESSRELQRADRLKLVGTLTYGLAHNLNNALAPIANLAHAASWRHPDDEKLNGMMALVLSNVERCADIVRRLRDLTRLGSGELALVQVESVLEESLEIVRRNMSEAGIHVDRQFGETAEIRGNPVELWEVFTNLLVNATEALAGAPREQQRQVTVSTRQIGDEVTVEINDNGPGMSADVRDKALEPWFSTKPEGEASGIGLWITSRIVQEHQGRVEIDSVVGRGTKVRVIFPVAAAHQADDGAPRANRVAEQDPR